MTSNRVFFYSDSQECDLVPWDSVRQSRSIYLADNLIYFFFNDVDDLVKLIYDTPEKAKENLLRLLSEGEKFSSESELATLRAELDDVRHTVNTLWVCPGMPGYEIAAESFTSRSTSTDLKQNVA